MKSFTMAQYRQANCPQIVGDSMNKGSPATMSMIHQHTGGRVCDTGCSWFGDGKCAAYKMLISERPFSDVQPVFTENVRDEAARLNLSINEVRRRRRG